jgi:type III pantothenate kinase
MNLLIDLGNTRLKWAVWQEGRRSIGGVFAHRERTLEAGLGTNWASLPKPSAVYVASVVDPEFEQALIETVREHFDQAPIFVRTPANALGVRNAYAQPDRLGIDRFLGLCALHNAAPRAQILVSCGTALTLDALDRDGRHLGGLIAPSPSLMRHALNLGTARVGGAAGDLVEIADNTVDAAYSGSVLSAMSLIERFHHQVTQRLEAPIAIVADGGGVEEWIHLLPQIERGRDLVLRGLALWADHANIETSSAEPMSRSG